MDSTEMRQFAVTLREVAGEENSDGELFDLLQQATNLIDDLLDYREATKATHYSSAASQELLERVREKDEFCPLEDGYIYYWPSGTGAIPAYALRIIADELDRLNAEWDKQVHAEFNKDHAALPKPPAK